MLLQQDVAVGPFAKAGNAFEFALGNSVAEFGRTSIEFDYFLSVQPILNMLVMRNNAGAIPFTDRVGGLIGNGRHNVIKCAELAIAVVSEFRVRMAIVVKD